MTDNRQTVALIAGCGRGPFLVARGMRAAGLRVVILGLKGAASPRLAGLADEFRWVGIARIGSWLAALARARATEAVMMGGVKKGEIYSPFRFLRYIPDIRTAWLWYVRVRKDKRDNAVLLAVADELKKEGIELVSSVKYCPEHLADEGLMTRTPVPRSCEQDIDFGWRIARASADLDIGQSIAVKERDIIAVEAVEGTDAMIRRAGELCPTGDWTLVKVARPNQDMRFDVPTVGPSTIRNLRDAGCSCLVVEAGKTLIVDKPDTLALADKLGMAVLGMVAGSR